MGTLTSSEPGPWAPSERLLPGGFSLFFLKERLLPLPSVEPCAPAAEPSSLLAKGGTKTDRTSGLRAGGAPGPLFWAT